jgi:hypothetical protein
MSDEPDYGTHHGTDDRTHGDTHLKPDQEPDDAAELHDQPGPADRRQ